MADGITLDKVNVEIESNSSKASSGIDKLTESINRLKSSLKGGIKELDGLNSTLEKISKSFNNFNTANTGINNAQKNASSLGNEIKSLSESYKSAQKNQTNFGREIKNQRLNGELQYAVFEKQGKGMTELTKISEKGITVTRKLTNENKKLSKALNLVKVAAAFKGLSMVYKKIMNLVEGSSQYISNLNYFNTTMGEMGERGTKFVNQMSQDFYLDPSNLMNYMASFNSLIKGFGIANEQAYDMSKNLTQLSYDLAAFKGLSIEDAMQKIKSGISGELEPMRAIGVALDQATLQEAAYELGIKKRVTTMTRAQKTELLYYQMMKSTAEAQNYFASTLAKVGTRLDGSTKLILNPATALAILKEQFSQLGRAIGNIFIPIFTAMIPYIMAATQLLRDLANAIAGFLGFDIKDYDFSKATKSVSGGIKGIGNEADKAGKKVKGMIAPFDELNTIDFGSGSGADTALSGGSLGIDTKGYEWLKNKDLQDRVEGIKKSMETLLPIVGIVVGLFAAWKITAGVAGFIDKVRKVGSIFGVGKYTSLLTGTGQIANTTKATASSLKIPSVKTILKGLADLAIIILGTEAIIIAAGAILAIPYFRGFLTSGINGLIEIF